MPRETSEVEPTVVPRLVAACWAVTIAAILLRSPCGFHDGGVFPIYMFAADRWLSSGDSYDLPVTMDVYRYPPSATAVLSAFAAMPRPAGLLLWQLLNAAVFIAGFDWFSRRVIDSGAFSASQRAALWLLLLPLSLSSLGNSQANPVMVGLLLAGVAAAEAGRWRTAALCLAPACVLKVYPIAVPLLLVLTCGRRFARPFAAALAVCCLAPFLTQQSDFVIDQWQRWLAVIGQDQRWLLAPERGYRDLWMLLQVCDISVSLPVYRVAQATLALLTAGMCWWAQRSGMPRRQVLGIVVAQASCWLILCGPSAEWATYILLAPVLSWRTVAAWRTGRRSERILVAALQASFLIHVAVRIAPGGAGSIWQFLPVSALLLWAYCVWTQAGAIRRCCREQGGKGHAREERMVHGLVNA